MGRWAQAQRRGGSRLPTGGRLGPPTGDDFWWYQDASDAVAEMKQWPPAGGDCIMFQARVDGGPWGEVSGSGDIPDPCVMLNELEADQFVECRAAWGSGWPDWPATQISEWSEIAGFAVTY